MSSRLRRIDRQQFYHRILLRAISRLRYQRRFSTFRNFHYTWSSDRNLILQADSSYRYGEIYRHCRTR